MLVVWNQWADEGVALDMVLGKNPVAVDLWGNRMPVPMIDGRHYLPLGRDPIFIEGIDPRLALFRSGFALSDPMIESTQMPHARTLSLTNPWPHTITGKLILTGPEGWRFAPSQHYFSLASGRSVELPLTITFPIAEVAGSKRLTARAEFRADNAYQIELSTLMELGLPGIDYQATLALVPPPEVSPAPPEGLGGAGDGRLNGFVGAGPTLGRAGETSGETSGAVVSAVITNTGDTEQSLYVFASLAGHPRHEKIISKLEPGESVVKSFRFAGALEALGRFPIRTGIRQTDGPAILNKTLSLDDAQ